MQNLSRKGRILLLCFFAVPVCCLAVLFSSCLGKGSIFVTFRLFSEALKNPFSVRFNAYTGKCVLLFLLLYTAGCILAFSRSADKRPGAEHGSAKWGSPEELNRMLSQKSSFPLTKHVRIGLDTHMHRRNLNILTVGGSGAGKTRGLVLPGILDCCAHPDLAYNPVITDPKGEILAKTKDLLTESGYSVRVLNLVHPEESDKYNPFRYIRNDTDVLKLVTNLIRNTTPKGSSSGDPFWEKAETALLEALIFYLLEECVEDDQNFSSVLEMLSLFTADEEHDTRNNELDIMFRNFEQKHPDHIAVKQYRVFRSATAKTAMSIIVSLSVRLSAFNLPSIRRMTKQDSLCLSDLGKRKTAVFIVIPDNDSSLSYLVGMLYTQIIQELFIQADSRDSGDLKRHVRMILDEFANIPAPYEFEKALATMRSRNISATIILQNLAQLKTMYPNNTWETITGNCDTFLYLGGNEQSTHEYVSKLLGKQTIQANSFSDSSGKNGHHSKSTNFTHRELLDPSEVRLLDNRYAILFVRGFEPVKDEKIELEKHPLYRKMQSLQKTGKSCFVSPSELFAKDTGSYILFGE